MVNKGVKQMSSKTKNWNKKPGQAGFEYGPSKDYREWRRKNHAAKKMRQRARKEELGI